MIPAPLLPTEAPPPSSSLIPKDEFRLALSLCLSRKGRTLGAMEFEDAWAEFAGMPGGGVQ